MDIKLFESVGKQPSGLRALQTILFIAFVGREPIQDDLERAFCSQSGEPGHWDCGWCTQCHRPYYTCRHLAPRRS